MRLAVQYDVDVAVCEERNLTSLQVECVNRARCHPGIRDEVDPVSFGIEFRALDAFELLRKVRHRRDELWPGSALQDKFRVGTIDAGDPDISHWGPLASYEMTTVRRLV